MGNRNLHGHSAGRCPVHQITWLWYYLISAVFGLDLKIQCHHRILTILHFTYRTGLLLYCKGSSGLSLVKLTLINPCSKKKYSKQSPSQCHSLPLMILFILLCCIPRPVFSSFSCPFIFPLHEFYSFRLSYSLQFPYLSAFCSFVASHRVQLDFFKLRTFFWKGQKMA